MKTEILKFFENFEIWNFLKFMKFWHFLKILKFWTLNFLKKQFYFEFWNFLKFLERNFWNFEIVRNFWSFEICCQFNSLSSNSLLKTIDASIDHWGAKKAKNILKYVVT